MKFTCSLMFAISLLFVSCSKEGNDPAPPPAADNYLNTASGSSWDYRVVDNLGAGPAVDYTVTSTAGDSLIGGKSYHVYNSTLGRNEYRGVSGRNYYQFDSLPAGLGLGAVERLYLKDDGAKGSSWDQALSVTVPGSPFPVPITITNTITETGISRMVNNTNYTDVIQVSTSITSPLIPAAALVTNIDSYYAPRYGLIENTSIIHLDFAGMVEDLDTETRLVGATLK